MGLFDFSKKKTADTNKPVQQNDMRPVNKNGNVILAFEARLIEMGYDVKKHKQYLALIVNDELEIGVMVVENTDSHPNIMHLMVAASHQTYFPNGIIESVVGVGYSLEEQTNTALDNYINSTFVTIMDSFTDSHDPDLDFITTVNGKDVLWHPKLGTLNAQGQWNEYLNGEPLYDLLKNKIPNQLTTNKINWLKIYISKRADGEIIGECLFNNALWEAASNEIFDYAKTWEMPAGLRDLNNLLCSGDATRTT